MAAGDEQQQIRKGCAIFDQARQARGQRVRLQVVDGDVWQAVGNRDTFGELTSDDQAADQAGAGAGGDAAQIAEGDARAGHGFTGQGREMRQMRAGRDLRHHAAEGRVVAFLGQHGLGQDAPAGVQDGGGGFIAGRFDSENRAM